MLLNDLHHGHMVLFLDLGGLRDVALACVPLIRFLVPFRDNPDLVQNLPVIKADICRFLRLLLIRVLVFNRIIRLSVLLLWLQVLQAVKNLDEFVNVVLIVFQLEAAEQVLLDHGECHVVLAVPVHQVGSLLDLVDAASCNRPGSAPPRTVTSCLLQLLLERIVILRHF